MMQQPIRGKNCGVEGVMGDGNTNNYLNFTAT